MIYPLHRKVNTQKIQLHQIFLHLTAPPDTETAPETTTQPQSHHRATPTRQHTQTQKDHHRATETATARHQTPRHHQTETTPHPETPQNAPERPQSDFNTTLDLQTTPRTQSLKTQNTASQRETIHSVRPYHTAHQKDFMIL